MWHAGEHVHLLCPHVLIATSSAGSAIREMEATIYNGRPACARIPVRIGCFDGNYMGNQHRNTRRNPDHDAGQGADCQRLGGRRTEQRRGQLRQGPDVQSAGGVGHAVGRAGHVHGQPGGRGGARSPDRGTGERGLQRAGAAACADHAGRDGAVRRRCQRRRTGGDQRGEGGAGSPPERGWAAHCRA